ncbi:MAG: HNH endonuclease [Deltaproteobacteria bacterium]|nr:HNH endonuclease [Deltaproteobacteria bacterium]MBW2363504.1 HNH endonuclease [Deltaproteobacteria bacterium]
MKPDPKNKHKKKKPVDWTGFAYPKLAVKLSPYEYSKLKQRVHALDGWHCVNPNCSEIYRRSELHFHHIVPRGRLRLDISENGVTLCPACHRLVEDKILCLNFPEIIKNRKKS